MKVRTYGSSVENVKRLFSNAPTADVIPLKDAFIAWERPNPENVESHKAWLSNILFHLKYHDLVSPVYSFDTGRKKITALQLTLRGKKALGRIGENIENQKETTSTTNGENKPVSYANLTKMVAQFRKENEADYEVTFDVKLRKSSADVAGTG